MNSVSLVNRLARGPGLLAHLLGSLDGNLGQPGLFSHISLEKYLMFWIYETRDLR